MMLFRRPKRMSFRTVRLPRGHPSQAFRVRRDRRVKRSSEVSKRRRRITAKRLFDRRWSVTRNLRENRRRRKVQYRRHAVQKSRPPRTPAEPRKVRSNRLSVLQRPTNRHRSLRSTLSRETRPQPPEESTPRSTAVKRRRKRRRHILGAVGCHLFTHGESQFFNRHPVLARPLRQLQARHCQHERPVVMAAGGVVEADAAT